MLKRNKKSKFQKPAPCKQTLMFLRQFAGVYHAEPEMSGKLCSFIIN